MKALLLGLLIGGAAGAAVSPSDRTAAEKHWQVAQAYLAKGMPHHAHQEAEVAVALNPDHAAARAFLSGAPIPAAAPAAGASPSATTPAMAVALPSVAAEARRAYRESRLDDARRLAQDALATDPGNAVAGGILRDLDAEVWQPSPLAANDVLHELYEQGMKLYRQDAWEDAAGVFQKALAISPSHDQIRGAFNRTRSRAESTRGVAALARAKDAIAAGRRDEAKAALADVLAAQPGQPEAVALLESLGGGARAEERRAQARVHFNRGVESWEQGRWEDARREWELVATLDPDDAEAKKLLAKARAKVAAAKREARARLPALHEQALKEYQAGKVEGARRLYREILDLDPADEKAKHSLELIEGQGAGAPR